MMSALSPGLHYFCFCEFFCQCYNFHGISITVFTIIVLYVYLLPRTLKLLMKAFFVVTALIPLQVILSPALPQADIN